MGSGLAEVTRLLLQDEKRHQLLSGQLINGGPFLTVLLCSYKGKGSTYGSRNGLIWSLIVSVSQVFVIFLDDGRLLLLVASLCSAIHHDLLSPNIDSDQCRKVGGCIRKSL